MLKREGRAGSANPSLFGRRGEELAARALSRVSGAVGHASCEFFSGPEQIEDLYELGCRIAGASLFVGNNSGITHLAAAVGTTVVALFGPTDPLVWAPRGARVVQAPGSEEITVDRGAGGVRCWVRILVDLTPFCRRSVKTQKQ